MPQRRNPKIAPMQRRLMQRDTGTPQERRSPKQVNLGDVVTYQGEQWKIHDFDGTNFVLTRPGDAIEVSPQELAMAENRTRKSLSIKEKLDRLFIEDPVTEEFGALLDGTLSPERFDNQNQLADYLCEGNLLNISKIASQALSIPSGEYMVWVTDVGHTMLVPTQEEQRYSEVFESLQDQYEILTPDLLQHWSKVERVLAEEDEGQRPWNPEHQPAERGHTDAAGNPEETEEKDSGGSPIQSRVDPGDIDRPPILRAMEDRGFTVSSLATAAGVQPPAISRLLRTPKDRQGDPGGRNPSMGLAAKISKLLRMDPTALFPDIFGASGQEDLGARETPGNRGSGMKGAAHGSMRKGKATRKWTQGAG